MTEIRITTLVWDKWNIEHIARHDVLPAEVEQICHGLHTSLTGKKGRVLIVGLTKNSRMITAALDREDEEGVYYPVTARSSSRKERRLFKQMQRKGGEEAA